MDLLSQAFDPESFRKIGHHLIDKLGDYLYQAQHDPQLPVRPPLHPEEDLAHWQQDLHTPFRVEDMGEWFEKIIHTNIHILHPRYMGHQVAAAAPLCRPGRPAGFFDECRPGRIRDGKPPHCPGKDRGAGSSPGIGLSRIG
ncbi:MAG: hypothetical protein HC880_06430 [Bacteroidia bacterium]|nr:hypothetical protein [Bacteroidia bacterium]